MARFYFENCGDSQPEARFKVNFLLFIRIISVKQNTKYSIYTSKYNLNNVFRKKQYAISIIKNCSKSPMILGYINSVS